MTENLVNIQTNLNFMWVLMAAALVFFMQAGFMALESGLARAKNSINVCVKNLSDFVIAVAVFWIFGFGLMFGASYSGLWGTSDFLISIKDPWLTAFFVFQAVFVGTAATIDSGAVAGRTRFSSYLIMSALISGLIYPVFGHWAWGSLFHADQSGWLEKMGFIDFAGSTVVHSVGGWMALVGVLVVGPRIGKFSKEGKPQRLAPHNMSMAYLGTFILFFGWFGFNCGSTLEATSAIAPIAMNTILAACFACLSCSAISWINSPFEPKRPEGEMIANGVLGGLVAITAGCASVDTGGAVLIGLIAGAVVYFGIYFIERICKLDDVVGAIAVHGLCGAWGTLAVGFFITPEALGTTSRLHQIYVQGVGVLSAFGWTFGIGYIIMKSLDKIIGMRVSRDDEMIGLNISEHGASSSTLDLAQAMHRATTTGDFSEAVKVEVEIGTHIGDLSDGFNKMVDAIRNAMEKTKYQMVEAENARREAESSLKELGAQRQENVQQVVEYKRIESIAKDLYLIMKEAEETMSDISNSATTVDQSVEDLNKQCERIENVVDLIDGISSSTNLLSLNAMIEASNAGEVGKTFAVVAGEMKDLSNNTRNATQDVSQITSTIFEQLKRVLSDVNKQYESVNKGKEKISNAGKLIRLLVGNDSEESPEALDSAI